MKLCRRIAVVVAFFVAILSFACPVDDPSTAYNESETPLCIATPASVNIDAQLGDAALELHPLAILRIMSSDDEILTSIPTIVEGSQFRLEFLCALLC